MVREFSKEMIEAGGEFLALLDRAKFRVRAGFWFHFPESERWRLVIASPEVRLRGSLVAYRKIHSVVRKVPSASELFDDISAVPDTDPLVKLLRKGVGTGPRGRGIRLSRSGINGKYIDDAYIYRLS